MKIVWSQPALNDLENIRAYIARDSDFYATRFLQRLIQSVDCLESLPLAGRKVPEVSSESIREILFRNYRVVYRISNERVDVLAVIHGARDLGNWEKKPWEVE